MLAGEERRHWGDVSIQKSRQRCTDKGQTVPFAVTAPGQSCSVRCKFEATEGKGALRC